MKTRNYYIVLLNGQKAILTEHELKRYAKAVRVIKRISQKNIER